MSTVKVRKISQTMGRLAPTILTLAALAAVGKGQTSNLVFQYIAQGQSGATQVAPFGTIIFPSSVIGKSTSVTFLGLNQGTASTALTQASISGPGFAMSGLPVNAFIAPGGSVQTLITFTPTSQGASTGTLTLTFQTGNNPPVTDVFVLSGTALASTFVLSYIVNPGGNQTGITAGQELAFPNASVGGANTATFVVANQGNGQGTLNAVTSSGPPFSVLGLPLLPASIDAQKELRFTIQFQPLVSGAASGSLKLDLGGSTITIVLSGKAVGANLTYNFTVGGNTSSLTPGQTLALGGAQVGSVTSVTVSVVNTGDAAGQVGTMSVTPAVFTIIGAPALPATLAPQKSITFTVQYSPTTSGTVTGQLQIDNALFLLSATALGAQFALTAQIADIVTFVANNAPINFPNTVVGGHIAATIDVSNTGNQPLTVSNIAVSGADFVGSSYPALPMVLQPGKDLTFNITFTPDTLGIRAGTLQIDGRTFPLQGSGNAPPPVPAVQFSGVPTQANPLQQPTISLKIAQPYAYDISGQLTLTFSSASFADDPAIQFATGGRTVNFTIPANSTNATFGSSSAMPFQTGTVSGTIAFTPILMVANVNVTPAPAPTTTVQIPSGPPQILSVRLGAQSTTSFELLVSGYAATRQVSNIQLQFNPTTGAPLKTSSLSVDASSAFNTWYQSTTSQQYGSQFTVSITIVVNGSITDVQSVTATVANSVGTSSAVSVNLR